MSAVDTALTFLFIKKLNTPFNKWPAFKYGIIDAKGNVLRKKSTLKTSEENAAWTRLDIMICNIKKTLAKLPGGSTKTATAAASIYLLKEHKNDFNRDKLIRYINDYVITEDAATVNVGGGNVAGTGIGPDGEPPGKQAKLKKIRTIIRRKKTNGSQHESSR